MRRIAPFWLCWMLLAGSGWTRQGHWRHKPPAQWTLEDAVSIHFDSPWVVVEPKSSLQRGADLYRSDPVSGAGFVHYYVRLRSARPMLLAYACLRQLLPAPHLRLAIPFDPIAAAEFADQMQARNQIVVAVTSRPLRFAQALNLETFEGLAGSTFSKLEPGGAKIPLRHFVPPSRSLTGEALFIFERPTGRFLPPGTLRFTTEFRSGDGVRVRLAPAFSLRKLLFQGRPEF